MPFEPTYERRFSPTGRVEVTRVEQRGVTFRRTLVGLTDTVRAADVEHRDRRYLELCELRRGTPSGRVFWKRATDLLRPDRRLSPSQKYAIKRRALGSRLRDASDERQLDLWAPGP